MSTSLQIEMQVDDPRWRDALPKADELAETAVATALGTAKFSAPAAVSILLTDDQQIAELNRNFRGIDNPTNVLSFPAVETPRLPDELPVLGDIALAFDTLFREAESAGQPFRNHFLHLIVHASLHLIGYTHDMEEDAERMEALEINALAGLGVPNPYEGQTAYGTREP